MLARGGKLAVGVLILWILGIFGFDFLINPDGRRNNQQNPAAPAGAGTDTQVGWNSPGHHQPTREPVSQAPVAFTRTNEYLAVGTFNIQVLGQKKMSKPMVVDILVDIARQFDVLAIQELRERSQTTIPQLVDLINADGRRYSYIVGPRQGHTRSKEQYVFVYDTQRIELLSQPYLVPDPQDLLHREPMAATFRAITPYPHQSFTFTLLNIHTDPDVVDHELNVLPSAINYVRQVNPGEDDVILLGDLNASPRNLGNLANVPGIGAVLSPDIATNTRGTRHYDNMLLDRYRTTEFSGRSGVINLAQYYGLSLQEATEVSDHLPVWALFSTYEAAAPAMANQPNSVR